MPPARLPENYYFGGGATATSVSTSALLLFLLCAGLAFVVPRKHRLTPLLVAGLFIPFGNVVVIGNAHFTLQRCLLAVGWARVLLRDQRPRSHCRGLLTCGPIDVLVTLWAVSNAFFYSLNWGTVGAVVNRIGFLYNVLAGYYLLRIIISDYSCLIRTAKLLGIICIVVGTFMTIEGLTGINYLARVLGGGPVLSSMRDHAIRAQGPFAHPIVAGSIGAMLIPLFIGLWQAGEIGVTSAACFSAAGLAMVVTSHSSTPLMTCVAGLVGLLMWVAREHMKVLRWAAVVVMVGLQVSMKADVWFLIARLGALFGGSSWHRAQLVDQCIRHFGEWWLMGTRNNAYWGWDMWDVDNAYVGAAYSGGLATLVLFVWVLIEAYRTIGLTSSRLRAVTHVGAARVSWALGAVLFANSIGFWGVVYFDQSATIWYAILSMVALLPQLNLETVDERWRAHHQSRRPKPETGLWWGEATGRRDVLALDPDHEGSGTVSN